MVNLLIKLIAGPMILIVAALFLDNVSYPNLFYPILTGVSLALLAYAFEFVILRKRLLWISVVADFVLAVSTIYYVSNMLGGQKITFAGSIITGLLFTIIEYFIHRFLIQSGKVEEEPGMT